MVFESRLQAGFLLVLLPCASLSNASDHVLGHLTSKSDVYSFGVVLLELLTGKRSMDKSRPNGEQNLVEWARPHLYNKQRFHRLIDPSLEGRFSIRAAQKAVQMAARCLSRDPKTRPLMTEVVEALAPLLDLRDMACSSSFAQSERLQSSLSARSGYRLQAGSLTRSGQSLPVRSFSIQNVVHISPRNSNHPLPSPKPNANHPLPLPKRNANRA